MSESANGQAKVPGQGGSGGPNGSAAQGGGPPGGGTASAGPLASPNGATAHQGASARLQGTHYKWLALSNTTLGMLAATVNASIVIISLPAIFRGIKLTR